jgi:hypothetical protein
VLARISGDFDAVAAVIRSELRSLDRGLPPVTIETLADRVADTLARNRSWADVASAFGVVALVLALIGLYGTMAFTVSQRCLSSACVSLEWPRAQVRLEWRQGQSHGGAAARLKGGTFRGAGTRAPSPRGQLVGPPHSKSARAPIGRAQVEFNWRDSGATHELRLREKAARAEEEEEERGEGRTTQP